MSKLLILADTREMLVSSLCKHLMSALIVVQKTATHKGTYGYTMDLGVIQMTGNSFSKNGRRTQQPAHIASGALQTCPL